MEKIERIIIKVGSSSLCNHNGVLDLEKVLLLVQQIALLKKENKQILLVTSGAIAAGMGVVKLSEKPKEVAKKQALAAIGQTHLMHHYEVIFNMFKLNCAQVLLNHDDFKEGERLEHLRQTLYALFEMEVIPIINENDALAVEEIKVGDNDTLASLLVPIMPADLLILISDIDGLYDKNPNLHADAKLVSMVEHIDEEILQMIEDKQTALGTGGMATKIKAARYATQNHCHMVIMNGQDIHHLHELANGMCVGTWFKGE